MEFNHCAAPDRSSRRASAREPSAARDARRAGRAASAVAQLANDIGIPKGLSQFGLTEQHVPDVIDEAMKSGNVVVNPRATSKEELAAILRRAI